MIGGFLSQLGSDLSEAGSQIGSAVSSAFDFGVPDDGMASIGSWFSENMAGDGVFSTDGLFSSPVAEGIVSSDAVQDVSTEISSNIGDRVGDLLGERDLFTGAAAGAAGKDGGLLSFIKSDQGQAVLGSAAGMIWKNHQINKQREHEEDLIKRQKRHYKAAYVPAAVGSHPGA